MNKIHDTRIILKEDTTPEYIIERLNKGHYCDIGGVDDYHVKALYLFDVQMAYLNFFNSYNGNDYIWQGVFYKLIKNYNPSEKFQFAIIKNYRPTLFMLDLFTEKSKELYKALYEL